MQAEVGARLGEVCPEEDEEEITQIRELYGLALKVLPSALVMALAEPLMLVPEAPAPPRIVFPSRVQSWWHIRPLRRWHERAQGMRSSGTSTK
jgi:hypothetical protein